MVNRILFGCIIGAILLPSYMYSQTLNGKVKDIYGKGIGYANIYIENTSIGTIANELGEFRIRIPKEYVNYTLVISTVSFNSKRFPIVNLDFREIIIVNLEPFSLNSITITPNWTAKEIVGKAIENIPYNYPIKKFALKGIYTEAIRQNKSYAFLTEAAVSIIDLGFKRDLDKGFFLCEAMRISEDFRSMDKDALKYEQTYESNKFYTLLRDDYLRNWKQGHSSSFSPFINKSMLDIFNFHIDDYSSYDGQKVYRISFEPKQKPDSSIEYDNYV